MSQMKLSALALLTIASLSSNLQAAPSKTGFLFPPPQNMISKAEPMQITIQTPAKTENLTVVEVVSADPSLSIFSKTLKAADLTTSLKDTGPYTIFAPNDKAFAKLSPNALADLLKPENKEKLATLLNSHIIPGKLSLSDIKTGPLKTLNDKTLDIKKAADGTVTVNNAKVIRSEISGSNGVIYIIDTVVQ